MSKLNTKELVRCARLAFAEELECHWVLFANGTIVKLPRAYNDDVWGGATALLRQHQLSFLDDFAVHKLPGVEGWLVEIKEQAFYVYLHPSELQWEDGGAGLELGLVGKEKFMEDAKALQPVYVHLQPFNYES